MVGTLVDDGDAVKMKSANDFAEYLMWYILCHILLWAEIHHPVKVMWQN